MSDNGKGDSPRPISVDGETFKKNWEQTFPKNETTGKAEYDLEPMHFIERIHDVFYAPMKVSRPLETLGDPEE